ncbi:V-type proton ATPase subunit a3, partial [Cucurbita argyrosperma subsp. sororia]
MDLLLSEAMQLVHLIISNESAHRMISYLGLFQFKYYTSLRICLTEIIALCRNACFLSPFQRTYAAQVKLGEFEAESLEINDNNEKLQRNWSEQLEDKLVLQRRHGMFLLIRSYYNSVGLYSFVMLHTYTSSLQKITYYFLYGFRLEMTTDPTKQVKLVAFEMNFLSFNKGQMCLRQAVVDGSITDPVSGVKVSNGNPLVTVMPKANSELQGRVYSIVTFPFLFAVVFSDFHGICLLLATLYLIIREKNFSSQVPICSTDDFHEQFMRLPLTSHNCNVVLWISSSVSRNDLYRRKPAFSRTVPSASVNSVCPHYLLC